TERYKTGLDFELPLSRAALDVLAGATKIGKKGFVFTTSGEAGIGSFGRVKGGFDWLMLAQLPQAAVERGGDPERVTLAGWTIHDLRRTARSLMTQAGVAPDHAKRALGHVILGVRAVYDRHDYHAEKRAAFEALASRLDLILNPQPNVVPLRPGKA